MLYVHALNAGIPRALCEERRDLASHLASALPYMYALYVCLICMPYMYAFYAGIPKALCEEDATLELISKVPCPLQTAHR